MRLVLLVVVLLAAAPPPVRAQNRSAAPTSSNNLFEVADGAARRAIASDPAVTDHVARLRERFGDSEVQIIRLADPAAMSRSTNGTASPMTVPLSRTAVYSTMATDVHDRTEDGRRVWLATMRHEGARRADGRRGEDASAEAVLLSDPAGWYGSINAPEGLYRFVPLGNGLHALVREDWSTIGPDEGEETGHVPMRRDSTLEDYPVPCDPEYQDCPVRGPVTPPNYPPPTIYTVDVLVAYTPNAHLDALLTHPSVESLMAQAEVETNVSYYRSSIGNLSVRVHLMPSVSNYTEYSADVDKSRLGNYSDGHLDDVTARREAIGADVMILLVSNRTGRYPELGSAAIIQASASTAYAVVRAESATGIYTFGHEIGHLFGARHDTGVDNSNNPYTYGHGYVKRAPFYAPWISEWRTVMGYGNMQRIQRWSNPSVRYPDSGGHQTGTTDRENNASVLRSRASVLAGFRVSVATRNADPLAGTAGLDAAKTTGTDGLIANRTEADLPLSLTVSPNPTRGSSAVTFSLPHSGYTRVTVVDALGRVVAVLYDGEAMGQQVVRFDAEERPAGVYLARLESTDGIVTRQFTVLR